MGIVSVEVKVVPYTLPAALYNPRRQWDVEMVMPITIVRDEGGCVGYSQCMAPPRVVKAVVEDLFQPVLLGRNPDEASSIWEDMYKRCLPYEGRGLPVKVLGSLDVALWDLNGRLQRKPVCNLWGGTHRQVLCYASGGLYRRNDDLRQLSEEIGRYRELGFLGAKIKVGGKPFEEDVERVHAARAAAGPKMKLMLDAAYSFDARTAIRFAQAVEDCNIEFFETPVPLEALEDLARVRASSRIPIAGCENLSTRYGFRELILSGGIDILQLNPVTVGGLSEARKVLGLASAFGIECSLQCSGELDILASLQLAGYSRCVTSVEYHQVHRYLPEGLREESLVLTDGRLAPPNEVGLGFTPTTDFLQRLRTL